MKKVSARETGCQTTPPLDKYKSIIRGEGEESKDKTVTADLNETSQDEIPTNTARLAD